MHNIDLLLCFMDWLIKHVESPNAGKITKADVFFRIATAADY